MSGKWRCEKDKRIKSVDELLAIWDALHQVRPALDDSEICECEGNPLRYVCNCKGYKGVGICSHVLAINHILKAFNVRYELAMIGKRTCKKNKGKRVRHLTMAMSGK